MNVGVDVSHDTDWRHAQGVLHLYRRSKVATLLTVTKKLKSLCNVLNHKVCGIRYPTTTRLRLINVCWISNRGGQTDDQKGILKCYVITHLLAHKADNSELINNPVPGATLFVSARLRQGRDTEVTNTLSGYEKPEMVILCFRHHFAVGLKGAG